MLAFAGRVSHPIALTSDPAITAERIAFAIASYERTLIPDQTPWDDFMQGDQQALTPGQVNGWNFFQASQCSTCHAPPMFTDQTYRNIGMRPVAEERSRLLSSSSMAPSQSSSMLLQTSVAEGLTAEEASSQSSAELV